MRVKLSLSTLDELPGEVGRPTYARDALSPGILHFGVGNFHRAHQAVYLDRLMNAGAAHDFAILGVGTRPGDMSVRDALAGQDWLTTVVEQSATRSEARVTGAMTGMIAPGETAAILNALADPAIRIVSMTITEGGYFLDADTGAFNAGHPEIAADVANPGDPKTVFGLLLAGLERRRREGMPPFTVMSCDNLPHNGKVAKNTVVGLARLRDPALADWVEGEVAFPNGMVDRITPATSDRERGLLADMYGVIDAWPVFAEDYIQWVLEDHFPLGRPPLEGAGVEFVADVSAHEAMKIRILNGGHATIAYPAGLLGIHFVHEAMEHPLVSAFLDKVEREEIVPHIPPVPGTDLHDYLELIKRRFANPKIGDTVRRLCFDGSNRQPKFIVPSIRDRLASGAEAPGLALVSALWCRYCRGETEDSETIEPNDPHWDRLVERARAARDDPAAWLAMRDVYGDLGGNQRFASLFSSALTRIEGIGVEATLQSYLDQGP